MICYKDKTFCSAVCGNTSCHRHFGSEQEAGALKWWQDFLGKKNIPIDPPIAFSDFSIDCPYYKDPS